MMWNFHEIIIHSILLKCSNMYIHTAKSRHGYAVQEIIIDSTHCMQITVYPKKYAHGFVVLCFAVVMQSFIMNSHEVFIHISLLALGQSLDCHNASEVSLMDNV